MHVTHALAIEASPAAVWAVTEDVERWPEWQPTVTSVHRLDAGAFGVGSAARIKQPAQPDAVWTVIEHEPGRRFAWETRRPGLRFTGSHEVTPDGANTISHLRIEAAGPLAVLLWPVLRPVLRWSLAQENEGLRWRCERRAAALRPSTEPAGEAYTACAL